MCRFIIGKNQAKEFAAACAEQIIKEIAEAGKHDNELSNSEKNHESIANAA